MEFAASWSEWGLVGLFLASFLSATLLPFSSEAVLGAMALGEWGTASLLAVATVGNTLGGLTNYAIGRWVPPEKLLRRLGIDTAKAAGWQRFAQRYGAWGALACWLPVIGDPIALALGVLRVPFVPSALLMCLGKALRYLVVLSIMRGLLA